MIGSYRKSYKVLIFIFIRYISIHLEALVLVDLYETFYKISFSKLSF